MPVATLDSTSQTILDFEVEQTAGGEAVQSSVAKALAVLEALASFGEASVTELATTVRLPKSTTHRLLKALEERGFSARSGSRYCVGFRLVELANAAQSSENPDLRVLALPALERLFDQTHTTVHLAVLVPDGDVLYIEKITGSGGCRIPSHVGGRMPATCTALGKAILAHSSPSVIAAVLNGPLRRVTPRSIGLPQLLVDELIRTRQAGVAYDLEESRIGLYCVGAPVLVDGQAIAAVSCSGVSSASGLDRLAPYVVSAAKAIALRLEH